jgi:hypothetical protein
MYENVDLEVLRQQALQRIYNTPELLPYHDQLMYVEWDNLYAHYRWIMYTNVQEIIDWVLQVFDE